MIFPGNQGFRGYGLELQLIEGSVETAIKFQGHRVSNQEIAYDVDSFLKI